MKEIAIEFIHYVNDLLHREPFNFLVEGVYWWFILLVICPVIAWFQFLIMAWNLAIYLLGLRSPQIASPSARNDEQLAVIVTGCDTGFGKELVFALASKGFVVFSGCLNKESFQQFEGEPLVIPLKMDVTNDEEVNEASKTVSEWIESSQKGKKRYLHALVNNAGIGVIGLIDWNELSDYQKVMDVNYFGIIRCVKAFLPLLKSQAVARKNNVNSDHARIINLVSSAGLVAPMGYASTYGASKFAAECFTANLAQEMQIFGIKVTGFNPTFHETPIYSSMVDALTTRWETLSEETREEYGEEFGQHFVNSSQNFFAWKSCVAVNEMAHCLSLKHPPTKVLVGTDAKFVMNILSKVPSWVLFKLMSLDVVIKKPAAMK